MDPKHELGNFLRTAREARGLPKSELAAQCGKTGPAIGVFERGKNVPSPTTIALIIRSLRLTEEEKREAIRLYRAAGGELSDDILAEVDKSTPPEETARRVTLDRQYGISVIAEFLAKPVHAPLIEAILELRQQTEIEDSVLWNAVAMLITSQATMPKETWKQVLQSLQSE